MSIAAGTQHWNAALAGYGAVFATDPLSPSDLVAALAAVAVGVDAAISDFEQVADSSLATMEVLVRQSESSRTRPLWWPC